MRHRCGADLQPDTVAVGVIAMMMRVEHETDWPLARRLDFRNDVLRSGREVPVDNEDEIREDDPSVVAVPLSCQVAFMKEHVGGDILDFADLGQQAG
jgi:hypothetical protein